METILRQMLHMAFSAGFIIAAILILRLIFHRCSRNIMIGLWALVAIRLIVPFSFASKYALIPQLPEPMTAISSEELPSMEIHRTEREQTAWHSATTQEESYRPTFIMPSTSALETGGSVTQEETRLPQPETMEQATETRREEVAVPIVPTKAEPTKNESKAVATEEAAEQTQASEELSQKGFAAISLWVGEHTGSLMLIWLAGVLGMLVYAFYGYHAIHKKVCAAVEISPDIWLSDYITTPFILGVFHSRIYLPSFISEADAAIVKEHELEHKRHFDPLLKMLGFLLLALYWYQPMCWIAYYMFCRDLEVACDERVIWNMGLEQRKQYSETLLRMSMGKGRLGFGPVAFSEEDVMGRIKKVLNFRKPKKWFTALVLVYAMMLGACFMTDAKKETEPSQETTQSISTEGSTADAAEKSTAATEATTEIATEATTEETEAPTEEPTKKPYPGTSWKIDEGILTIQVKGEWPADYCPWLENGEMITSVVIEEGVTSVGAGVFHEGLEQVTEVRFPSTLTYISDDVVFGTDGSVRITAPELYDLLYEKVYMNHEFCSEEEFQQKPYYSYDVLCKNDMLFVHRERLDDFLVKLSPNRYFCEIIDYYGNAEELVIPSTINGMPVFQVCVQSIEGHENVKRIIVSEKNLGYSFGSAQQLWSLPNVREFVLEDQKKYTVVDGILYDRNCTILFKCPKGKEGKVVLPDTVLYISGEAFHNCSKLTEIVMPESMIDIGSGFSGCSGIKEMTIPNMQYLAKFDNMTSLETLTVRGGVLDTYVSTGNFSGNQSLKEIRFEGRIGGIHGDLFGICPALTDFYCGNSQEEKELFTEQSGGDRVIIHYGEVEKQPTYIWDNSIYFDSVIDISAIGAVEKEGVWYKKTNDFAFVSSHDVQMFAGRDVNGAVVTVPAWKPMLICGSDRMSWLYFESDDGIYKGWLNLPDAYSEHVVTPVGEKGFYECFDMVSTISGYYGDVINVTYDNSLFADMADDEVKMKHFSDAAELKDFFSEHEDVLINNLKFCKEYERTLENLMRYPRGPESEKMALVYFKSSKPYEHVSEEMKTASDGKRYLAITGYEYETGSSPVNEGPVGYFFLTYMPELDEYETKVIPVKNSR